LDERLYLREEIDRITTLIKDLQGVLLELAERNLEVILPGYTLIAREALGISIKR